MHCKNQPSLKKKKKKKDFTMVRKIKVRKSGKRNLRRRFTARRRINQFPPTIPFNRYFMNVTLRHSMLTLRYLIYVPVLGIV